MKRIMTVAVAFPLLALVCFAVQPAPVNEDLSTDFETRCGWFSNPTPANAWLTDREAQWTVGVQGGFQAEGEWPYFKPRQWVKTNVNYGYGCACLKVRVNKQTHEILEIKSSRALSLSHCRLDPALKKWGRR